MKLLVHAIGTKLHKRISNRGIMEQFIIGDKKRRTKQTRGLLRHTGHRMSPSSYKRMKKLF